MVGEFIQRCSEIMTPRGGYTRIKTGTPEPSGEIVLDRMRFEPGKIIGKMLRGSEEYAFFMATAGPEPEILSRSLISKGQFLEGYIVDLIGSAIVESAADQVQEQISRLAAIEGMRITNRYSPGYCTWNISDQQKLFGLFPKGCCGITLSDSSLMSPIKSVSGIIGIGKEVKHNEYTCEICSMKKCAYRRIGPREPKTL
jgi:hypothetical protein